MPFDQLIEQEITPAIFKTLSSHDRLLALADYLETLPPGEFAMSTWTFLCECETPACICGHALHKFDNKKFGKRVRSEFGGWVESGASLLGLDTETAESMFKEPLNPRYPTPTDAAWMLRNYVLTGEVKWESRHV